MSKNNVMPDKEIIIENNVSIPDFINIINVDSSIKKHSTPKTGSVLRNLNINQNAFEQPNVKRRKRRYVSPCPEMKIHHDHAMAKNQRGPKEPFI